MTNAILYPLAGFRKWLETARGKRRGGGEP
jgi:hypothetical protein